MVRRLLLVVVAVACVAGCGSPGPGQPGVVSVPVARVRAVVAPPDSAALRAGNSLFAGRLLSLLASGQPTVALSPLSISDALAMTFAGARGETASQLATALDFILPSARLHDAFGGLNQALAADNGPGVTVSIANALFGQRGTQFGQAFLSVLARDYGAGIQTVDFQHAPAAARAEINAWVAQHTQGKITNLLSPADVDALTRLVLVNAVYLNAKWAMPFAKEATSPAPFHAPGATVMVPTMSQTATLGYRRGHGYQAVELPYRGGRLALDVLLPDRGRLPRLMRGLTTRGPLAALRGLKPTSLHVALPKLMLRTHFELAGALETLGMPLAFMSGGADLSGIAGAPGDLFIGGVVHEAYIRVDEAGTEAAAATAVTIEATSGLSSRINFDVNRPFVFVLRDTMTSAILFLGKVSRP